MLFLGACRKQTHQSIAAIWLNDASFLGRDTEPNPFKLVNFSHY